MHKLVEEFEKVINEAKEKMPRGSGDEYAELCRLIAEAEKFINSLKEELSKQPEKKMKLYEYKTKYITKLTLYQPKSKRESELRDMLINRVYPARAMNMPLIVHTLYQVIVHEDVSEEFKQICREMIEDASRVGE